ncbi:U4/U6.U5 tri-snRNP-associated protein 1 [Paragonimus westermani]|uniref:U4/U6.U5 tri-snRNP-associated protein 1 n=1 Tax=Paragonimus westermani TaxID=34504 RepID=A0A5J4NBC7_9TREM|nr:U4/U6.U5 tri-snRNP-associated protein 1 [Paragonimus westermani]
MHDKSGEHSSDRKRRHHKSRERARSPFGENGDVSHHNERRSTRRRTEVNSYSDDASVAAGGGGDISLSIEETNALRAKLGLAPLELDDTAPAEDEQRIVDNQSENYVHAPAKDLRKARESEALKEKLAVHKDKRALYDKMASSRLYEPAEKDLSVSSWVEKIREKERIKKQAQERAKVLTELDEQYNNDDLVIPHYSSTPGISYKPSDLSGLKIEHKVDSFREGKSIILTLKDRGVLDETDDTDVLVNVNLVDDEKAEVNRENTRKVAGLAGIADEEDEDVLLGLKQKGVLSKYDAEIDGARTSKFTIGPEGTYVPEAERVLEQLHAELRAGKQSLADTELRVASEYFSEEELQAKFKKRTRRVKTRKRSALTADDLLDADSQNTSTDLGSRGSRRPQSGALAEPDSHHVEEVALATAHDPAPYGSFFHSHLEGDAGEDDLREEIQKTINRVVKSKSAVYVKPEDVAAQLLSRKHDESEVAQSVSTADSGCVVFDSTAEFYKSIGSGLQETMRQHARLGQLKPEDVSDDEEQEDTKYPCDEAGEWGVTKGEDSDEISVTDEDCPTDEQKSSSNRWHTVGEDSSNARRPLHKTKSTRTPTGPVNSTSKEVHEEKHLTGVLDDEPCLDSGLFSALKLAGKKGYLDKGEEKSTGTGTMVNLMAKHFVQEDVRYDDIDAKFAKRDRYTAGPLSEFKDLKHYKPEVKLEYVDELGRQLNAKEAFRQLSHKFHGKGSGKNKIENRMKKIREEFVSFV